MKDYSNNKNEAKKYILSYKIAEDKLVIKLASGETYEVPYTKENEKRIISIMKDQVKSAKVKDYSILVTGCLSIIVGLSIATAIGISIGIIPQFLLHIPLSLIAVSTLAFSVSRIRYVFQKNNLKKLDYFLNHEEELNGNKAKYKNAKLNLSKKTTKKLEAAQCTEEMPINLNNIDDYSLEDLKTIVDNLRRINFLMLEESEEHLIQPNDETPSDEHLISETPENIAEHNENVLKKALINNHK